MPRIQLIVEYDGTRYAGWQRQENALAVQQVLEERLSALTKEKIVLHGASRTDAGVHARGQSAHFDTLSRIPPEKFSFAVNTMLPEDIRVRLSREVPETFHARFSTKGKRYLLSVPGQPAFKPSESIDARARDLSAGRRKSCRRRRAIWSAHTILPRLPRADPSFSDTVRTIYRADIVRNGEEIRLTIEGNGFLYNMVRIIAGTLVGVGNEKTRARCISRARFKAAIGLIWA